MHCSSEWHNVDMYVKMALSHLDNETEGNIFYGLSE